jgi:3-hydroxyacyl-[acyl-carrier-protein] dehydratase
MNELRKGIAAAAITDISTDGPDTAVRGYRFDADFVGFSGHFPGNPILPAIVQIRTAVSLAEERAGRPLRLVEVRSAKFLSPIPPGKDVTFRYRWADGDGERLCDAAVSVDGKTAATFLLQLADEEERR